MGAFITNFFADEGSSELPELSVELTLVHLVDVEVEISGKVLVDAVEVRHVVKAHNVLLNALDLVNLVLHGSLMVSRHVE